MDGKKLRNLIILIGAIVVFLAIGIVALIHGRGERVTTNPDGTVGNTGGNLNNGGLVVEYKDKVYFANSYDGDSLYIMNPDETEITKISTASVQNLLAGGDYLYFFQTGASGATGLGGIRTPHSFVRCKLDGSKGYYLLRSTVTKGQLVDNYLYILGYYDDGRRRFYKIKIDRSDEVDLADYEINPSSAANGRIYYNGTTNNHAIYSLNTAGDTSSMLLDGNYWEPVIDGDYLYFLDLENGYQLRRYSMSSNTMEILSNEPVQFFNVGYGYIYYQTMGETAYLGVMGTDGSNPRAIASGEFNSINMTSRYVYFKNFFEEGVLYHAPLGGTSYEVFYGAQQAAFENLIPKEEEEEAK